MNNILYFICSYLILNFLFIPDSTHLKLDIYNGLDTFHSRSGHLTPDISDCIWLLKHRHHVSFDTLMGI